MTTWESPWQRRISNCWNSSCCPRECCATNERATAVPAPSPAMRLVRRRRQQRQTDEQCELCCVAATSSATATLAIRELLCCRSPTKRPLGSTTLQSRPTVWEDGAAHAGDHDGGNKRVMINENNSSDSELLNFSGVSVVPQ